MPNNRRMGGPQRPGNRGFAQPFQGGSGLSPWQGSANMNQGGGLLSQLGSSPQQLALALTSLLSQQQQPVNNPPSLLTLNTNPAFSLQPNRFGGGNRGRDMRRHEPYNKNRQQQGGGWRQDNRNNNRNNNRNQPNRGGNQQQNKGKPAQGQAKPKDGKNEPAKSKAKSPDKKKDDDTIDLSMDEEDGETKRDWKDEKNQSGEGKDGDGDNKEGKFHGVPVKFLNCFVCNKEMWDGESMDKHVKGRAHKEMFKALEESIHITVNILRENMRLSEERKMIEMNRLHRLKKNFHKFNDYESHCNMCDLKFMGKITSHRKTEGHQRLKQYLHPKCATCAKEFPSRLDWIEHRLTPEHLRKLADDMKDQLGGADGADIIQGEEDDLDIEPLLEEPLQLESEKPILELDDQLEGLQNFMPAYRPDRAVASKNLKPFSGFVCDLCQRSFPDELVAKEHLKTKRHYTEFVGKIKEIYLRREKDKKELAEKEKADKDAAKKTETEETPQEGEDAEMYDPESVTNEEEEAEAAEEEETEENEDADTTIKANDINGEKMEEDQPQEEEEGIKEEIKEEEVAEEEEVKEEPKEEVKPVVKTSPARRGVKNGAGPKSKKMAVAATTAAAPEQKTGPGYRIPKVSKPAPASKKK